MKIRKKITIGTDCSGIDAPIVALEQMEVKYDHVFSCDNNKWCKQNIMANHNPKTFYDDMINRDVKKMKTVDLYVCGFPCQPFSKAGKLKGFDDDRGNIFFHCFDYIKNKNPTVFILENVKGLVQHDKGNTMKTIKTYLKKLKDYEVSYFLLNTKDYGIPQNRERIFIIGRLKSHIKSVLNEPKKQELKIGVTDLMGVYPKKKYPELYNVSNKALLTKHLDYGSKKHNVNVNKAPIIFDVNSSIGWGTYGNNICPTLRTRSKFYISQKKRKLHPNELLKLQGFTNSFNNVVSNGQFIKQIGNTMSVNVLVALFTEIFKSTRL